MAQETTAGIDEWDCIEFKSLPDGKEIIKRVMRQARERERGLLVIYPHVNPPVKGIDV